MRTSKKSVKHGAVQMITKKSDKEAVRNTNRKKPLRTLTLSDKAWARLKKIADLDNRSRSYIVEQFALSTPLKSEIDHGPR